MATDGAHRTAEFWVSRCLLQSGEVGRGGTHVGAAAGGTVDHTQQKMINEPECSLRA